MKILFAVVVGIPMSALIIYLTLGTIAAYQSVIQTVVAVVGGSLLIGWCIYREIELEIRGG